VGELGSAGHAAPDESDLAAIVTGYVPNQLQAVNGGADAADDDAALRAIKNLFEAGKNGGYIVLPSGQPGCWRASCARHAAGDQISVDIG